MVEHIADFEITKGSKSIPSINDDFKITIDSADY